MSAVDDDAIRTMVTFGLEDTASAVLVDGGVELRDRDVLVWLSPLCVEHLHGLLFPAGE